MNNNRPRTADASFLGRVAGWCHDHRRLVLGVWIVLLVATTVLAQAAGSRYDDKFSGNGPSQRAQDIINAQFPAEKGDHADVVFSTTAPVGDPANQAAIARLGAELRRAPGVSLVQLPGAGAPGQVAPSGHIAYAVVQFDQTADKIPAAQVQRVITLATAARHAGFDVQLGGAPIADVVHAQPGSSEGIGILAAMLIMLMAFGSVVAMGLPIMTALFGLAVGTGLLELLSHVLIVPTFGPEMAAMIGIGVGIDYALFIVTRYRQGLQEERLPREAVVVALATAGRAVLFAGCTVVISLVGLYLMNLPFMVGLATGAIAAVVLVMAAALTLLPAMLGFAGRAIDRLHVPFFLTQGRSGSGRGFWYRWSRLVQRRAAVMAVLAALVLVLLTLPLFSMRLAFTDAGNDPTSLTTRQAYDLLAQGFGPGANGPLVVAADLHGSAAPMDHLADVLRRTPGVAYVVPPRVNAAGTGALLVVIPTTSPQSAATAGLVQHLRNEVIPEAVAGTGVQPQVGGETAGSADAAAYLGRRLPLVIGAVILLACLLLLAVFRSVVIPLKAAVMNLLSIGAAYGVIVAVFQWGWLGGVIGIGATGPIDPWIPLMMFTILFGLSMDYEVFLLSRIREEWLRTGDNSASVADGLAGTARVITAAAAIMVCVFGSFVINDPLRVLKVFGLGLAASVFIDATLVRMVLVPSVMELLGKANWWIPSWLDRIVPTLGVEIDPDAAPGRPVAAPAPVR